MRKPIKPLVYLVAAELAVLGLLVFAVWTVNSDWVASTATGGLVFIIPDTYFTFYAFRHINNHQSRWFLIAFYRGHTGKVLLAAVGFALAFNFVRPLHPPSLLLAFCLLMIAHTVVATRICRHLENRTN